MTLPKQGLDRETLFSQMRERKTQDADWHGARTFSLVYPAGDEVDSILAEANELYLYENALNPLRFPSLRQMEVEVVEVTKGLLHAPEEAAGCMTSGGTESILMAMKAARDRAKDERGVTEPQLLAPVSAHPAFAKAAHYLGLEHVQIPIDGNYKADLRETERLIGDRTAVVVGSCPNYPFGTADPIPEMAAMASERGISFHTDACLGGFLLPFYEKLGEPVPPFDFRVPGVTTISADVHKYGYATKGASIVTHRDGEHLKKYQRFLYDRWPGGLYLSFAMAGARPAAPIAAAWAILHYLGEEGYVKLAAQIRDAVKQIQAGIADIPELTVVGEPIMSVFAFTAAEGSGIDPFAVGDAMDQKGWCIDRQHGPNALHLMISPKHLSVVDAFLSDLRDAVKNHGPSQGKEIRYS
ncbi:MAG: aspartate aminotransferase family protein [Deltaproteobacteria bacterium]|nr:aspartate aminotransferase family protein [Deltaproteobacteria bacterium]